MLLVNTVFIHSRKIRDKTLIPAPAMQGEGGSKQGLPLIGD